MIATWNVRGQNKTSKLMEISSRLLKLRPDINILIETRVKFHKAKSIRNKLNLKGLYIDNYQHHDNGCI